MKRASRINRSEAGATMVEGAIAMVVLSVVMLGIVAGALMARSYAAVQNAAAAGARAAAVGAKDADADHMAMEAAKRNLSSISLSSVQNFIVYKADAANSPAPNECLGNPNGIVGKCNRYDSTDLLRTQADFTSPSFVKDDSWPAPDRKTSRTQGTDMVGVSITARCDCFTSAFGFDPIITRSATVPLEARSY